MVQHMGADVMYTHFSSISQLALCFFFSLVVVHISPTSDEKIVFVSMKKYPRITFFVLFVALKLDIFFVFCKKQKKIDLWTIYKYNKCWSFNFEYGNFEKCDTFIIIRNTFAVFLVELDTVRAWFHKNCIKRILLKGKQHFTFKKWTENEFLLCELSKCAPHFRNSDMM